jgi:IS5 family transposase
VFGTLSDQPSLRESQLPAELLRLPEELARVDALLDDPAFFAPFAPHFHWRRFCWIGLDGTVPRPTTLMKLTTRCGEGAVAGLNEALLAKAAGAKLLRTARVRGKLAGEERSQVIGRVTGELAELACTATAQAAAVLRNGRRAVPKAISGRVRGRLRRALDELAVTIERTATIVAQTRSRLAGQMPDGATRLVSLHDPDARPIRKGRTGKPAGVRVQGPGHGQR